MIAFKSEDKRCVEKNCSLYFLISCPSHQSQNNINALRASRKHKALKKLLKPGDLGSLGFTDSTLDSS